MTPKFLNIGSGQRKFNAPWKNLDTNARWLPDIVEDANIYLARQPSESVRTICLHHVLEHFGCPEGAALLRECHRVLERNGSLLTFVPDLRALATMWTKGQLTDETYIINLYGAYMGDEEDRHRWGFTRGTLDASLRFVGFRFVAPFDWRHIEGADIARDTWILGMEAVK